MCVLIAAVYLFTEVLPQHTALWGSVSSKYQTLHSASSLVVNMQTWRWEKHWDQWGQRAAVIAMLNMQCCLMICSPAQLHLAVFFFFFFLLVPLYQGRFTDWVSFFLGLTFVLVTLDYSATFYYSTFCTFFWTFSAGACLVLENPFECANVKLCSSFGRCVLLLLCFLAYPTDFIFNIPYSREPIQTAKQWKHV